MEAQPAPADGWASDRLHASPENNATRIGATAFTAYPIRHSLLLVTAKDIFKRHNPLQNPLAGPILNGQNRPTRQIGDRAIQRQIRKRSGIRSGLMARSKSVSGVCVPAIEVNSLRFMEYQEPSRSFTSNMGASATPSCAVTSSSVAVPGKTGMYTGRRASSKCRTLSSRCSSMEGRSSPS